jgi:sugar phosphate isomerase/epimerase
MADKPPELCDCNSDRRLPGQGCLDLKALLRKIERHGYKGYFAIEMFDKKLWRMTPARAAGLMYESLAALCR